MRSSGANYHYKSADWTDNKPFRLASRTAAEMAKMPMYRFRFPGQVGGLIMPPSG